ncbi:MAG: HEAT repeat domain-containing protein [Pseudomonadota bacterium]
MKTVLGLALACLMALPPFALNAAPAPEGAAAADPHLDYWVRTLKSHPLKLVRKNAARSLGKMGTREAIPSLVAALKDPDPGVRAEAAKSLGLLGDEKAFGPLHDASSNDSDREVRRAAANSIETIKSFLENEKKKEAKDENARLKKSQ